ncbi:target of myb protein [Anaeramoeba flamelloides]|uniref:Target of myb protein n=1 Tax=Anaeramoeba flamelloides TaxID=1746091 RepID=A0AAV8AER7_9EUKA|nr:target of myb protein [Anaeramoeba flamelloides]
MSSKMTNRLFYLIHEATSETEHEPNMKKNLSIIDRCSKSPFKQKDLAQELKCRLKKKNLTIRFLSIVLLDMCAKNLKGTFVKNLNQKSYMKVLRQVATWKTQTELSERTLALIRYLKNNYSEYKIFSKTFQTLLHKGINFREDPEFGGGLNEKQLSKKVKTNNTQPKRTTNTTNNTFTSTRNNHQNHIIPEELKKVIQDLDVIKETVNLLTQLLLALEPNEKVQSNPLITELVENVKKFRQQLQGLIIEVSDEYVLKLVLETNDQVNNLIRYHTLMLKPNCK